MRKHLLAFVILSLLLTGCANAPEQIKVQPLPVDGPSLTWNELVQRSRMLAMSATEAFYRDEWTEVEHAGKSLEQTALHLPKSTDIPANRKASVDAHVQGLQTEAQNLQTAARAKDVDKVNENLQKIHARVRALGTD
jgi:hypothetical protein